MKNTRAFPAFYSRKRLIFRLLVISLTTLIGKFVFEFLGFIILRYLLSAIHSGDELTRNYVDVFGTVIALIGYLPIFVAYAVCGYFVSSKFQKGQIVIAYCFIWAVTVTSIYVVTPYIFVEFVLSSDMYVLINSLYYFVPLVGLVTGRAFHVKSRRNGVMSD